MRFSLKSLAVCVTVAGIIIATFPLAVIYYTVPIALIIALAVFGVHDLSGLVHEKEKIAFLTTIRGLRGLALLSIAIISGMLLQPFAPTGARLRDSSVANLRLFQRIESHADLINADAKLLLSQLETNTRIDRDFRNVPQSIRDLNPLSIADHGEMLVITMKPGDYVVALELVTDRCVFNSPFHREAGLWFWEGKKPPFQYTKIR